MKILVTGAAGFIGHAVSKELAKDNEVMAIDNFNNYYSPNLKNIRAKELSELGIHVKDLSLEHLFKIEKNYKPELVVHLAAQPGVRISYKNYDKYLKCNIDGFKSLLDFCVERKVSKVVYASSSSVYGDSELPSKESDACNPKSLYGFTKLFNESMSKIYSNEFDISMIGLRFFTIYGPYGRPDMAYFSFTNSIQKKDEIVLFNQGSMSREMTYIDDAVEGAMLAIKRLMKKGCINEIYNIGSDHTITTIELLNKIERMLSMSSRIKQEESDAEVLSTCSNLQQSKHELGYNPKISIEEGLDNFLKWKIDYDRKN